MATPHRLSVAKPAPWLAHWQAVYYYFDQWKAQGTFEQKNVALNQLDRVNANREVYPSALCIDSQSVNLSPRIDSYRGIDPHKRVNGRKRTFVVDTQGRLWLADVDAANQADGPLAKSIIVSILWPFGEQANDWKRFLATKRIMGYLRMN